SCTDFAGGCGGLEARPTLERDRLLAHAAAAGARTVVLPPWLDRQWAACRPDWPGLWRSPPTRSSRLVGLAGPFCHPRPAGPVELRTRRLQGGVTTLRRPLVEGSCPIPCRGLCGRPGGLLQ